MSNSESEILYFVQSDIFVFGKSDIESLSAFSDIIFAQPTRRELNITAKQYHLHSKYNSQKANITAEYSLEHSANDGMELYMKKKVLKWLPVAIWCCVIFFFSQQNGQESGNTSELAKKLFMLIGIDVNSILGEMATFIIRKGAHFTEYFILYLLTFNAFGNDKGLKRRLAGAMMFTAFYAVTDEIHQYFIPGRACALKDVLIDSSGGVLAGVIMYIRHKRSAER